MLYYGALIHDIGMLAIPKDIIESGKNGYLINQDDVRGLADAICKVIEDESLRKEMGRQSKIISKRFSQDNILPLWPVFLKKLIS